MKMNTYLKVSLLAAGLAAASAYAVDDSGTLKFNGQIISGACTVDGTLAPIAFGDVSGSAIIDGSVAKQDITINLTNCPAVNNVMLTTNGDKDVTNNKLLKLSDSSLATGFGIGLYNEDGSELAVQTESNPVAVNPELGTAVINLKAAPVKAGEVVTGGAFDATTSFTLSYN